MESSEREPSYYEVALTHRQLMVGLVVALTTVVVAFFAGVWIGRGAAPPAASGAIADAGTAARAEADKITFFGDKGEGAKPAAKPAPIAPKPATPVAGGAPASSLGSGPTPAATEADALRKTLEAEMAANRVDGGAVAGAPVATPTAVAPGTRVTQGSAEKSKKHGSAKAGSAPAAPASTSTASSAPASTAAPAPTAAGTLWIQVYSSTNRDRAVEISGKLKKSGFAVKMLEPGKDGGANYRVRVGPYSDRSHADHAASRLRREFKLDTWVTDTP